MKISKVEVAKTTPQQENSSTSEVDYGLHNYTNILNPTTFALIIKRNLSASWYKEAPELDVSGRLKSIEVGIYSHLINRHGCGDFRSRFSCRPISLSMTTIY